MIVVDDLPAPLVGIGGAKDHPGKKILDGSFKNKKNGVLGYNLVFCPIATAPLCYEIGKHSDKSGTDSYYVVVFPRLE